MAVWLKMIGFVIQHIWRISGLGYFKLISCTIQLKVLFINSLEKLLNSCDCKVDFRIVEMHPVKFQMKLLYARLYCNSLINCVTVASCTIIEILQMLKSWFNWMLLAPHQQIFMLQGIGAWAIPFFPDLQMNVGRLKAYLRYFVVLNIYYYFSRGCIVLKLQKIKTSN